MKLFPRLLVACIVVIRPSVQAQYIHILNCKEKTGIRDTVFLFNPYSASAVYRIPEGRLPEGVVVGMPYNAKIPASEVVSLDTLLYYAAEPCQVLGTEAYERMVLPMVKELYIYMKENLRYPEGMENKKIHGYVPVAFTIKSGQTAQSVRVLHSLHPLLDAEAVRLVTNIPADHWLVPGPREYRNMIFWGTYQCRMLIKF